MPIRAGVCLYGQAYADTGRYMSIRASVSSLQMQESISTQAAGRLYAVRFFVRRPAGDRQVHRPGWSADCWGSEVSCLRMPPAQVNAEIDDESGCADDPCDGKSQEFHVDCVIQRDYEQTPDRPQDTDTEKGDQGRNDGIAHAAESAE